MNLAGGVTGPGLMTFFFAGGDQGLATTASNDVLTFLNAIRARVYGPMTMTLDPVVANIDIPTGNLLGTFSGLGTTVTGADGGEPLPRTVQGLVQTHTAGVVHNRAVRGRLFIPGPTETNNEPPGTPTLAYRTQMSDAAGALASAVGSDWGCYSRRFLGTPSNPARLGTFHPITSAGTWNQWASLRSRRD